MILRITHVQVAGPTTLDLTFNDSVRKVVDLTPLLQDPVLQPLRDPQLFQQVALDRVAGTVVWPNGADLAPEALHDLIPATQRVAS